MFSLLRKLFAKKPSVAPPSIPAAAPMARTPRVVATSPSAQAAPQVAVAHLSLAAIIGKFPADLRGNVLVTPDASATVALPLATINKQLAAGAVKMSLASLYRQAPRGTFRESKSEEKRMIEVPLSEIMRHVDVSALRRREQQRKVELPKSAPQLFGDRKNPYMMTPSFHEEEAEAETEAEEEAQEFYGEADAPLPTPMLRMAPTAAAAFAPASGPGAATLSIPVADLCGAWPEQIRSEVLAQDGAVVELPLMPLGTAVSKGKVAFTWGQIRSWLSPAPVNGTGASEATELILPLKIVAPAFMAQSRPASARRTVEFDQTIPTLFGSAALAPEAVPELAPEPEAPAPAPVAAPSLKFVLNEEPAPAPAPAIALAPAPEPHPTPEPHVASEAPQTLGELFGKPDQKQWSAQEIIERTAKLPGIAGAILALQEGLVVAAHLPSNLKADTMAAFLPQIFARLNKYTGEMALGEVEDVLLSTNGAHFQAYRLGEVYFAALGQPGSALPWDALRLVIQELASQSPQ